MNKILLEYIESTFLHLHNEFINNKKSYRKISNIIKKYFLILYQNPSCISHLMTSYFADDKSYLFCRRKMSVYVRHVHNVLKNGVDSYFLYARHSSCQFRVKTRECDGYIITIRIYE